MLQIKEEMGTILHEFLVSQDIGEASHCLAELSVPYFHHEIVREALELAFEKPQVRACLIQRASSRMLGGEDAGYCADAQMVNARLDECGSSQGF